MLTKDILFHMNVLTLVGLLMTGFGLTLRRTARAGLPLCLSVMGVETALVMAGLCASAWPYLRLALFPVLGLEARLNDQASSLTKF